jgi:uncharacterized protein (DUF1697 family)
MAARQPTHLALLRAVNLPNHGKVAMTELRALLGTLGFNDGQTLLQSGNLFFRGGARTGPALERFLETEVEKRLGLRTDIFARTIAEWQSLVTHNPFQAEATSDPSHLVVVFLKDAVNRQQVDSLQAAITGPEIVRPLRRLHSGRPGVGREVYITYPDGIGRSRVTNQLIEKKLGTRCTGRNWNTVLKLLSVADPPPT